MKRMGSAVFVFFLSTFFLFTSVSIAPAAQAGPFYVGLFGGYAMPNDLEISGLFVEDRSVSLDSSWMLGAKFGYIFPSVKWLAVELEYYYLADQDIDEPGASGDFSASNLMANLLVRWPEGKFHPYAGFGLGWSWGELQANEALLDESNNDLAWQLLAGVNYEITPNWSAELEYRYFYCQYGIFSETEATNHIVSIGVNYHF